MSEYLVRRIVKFLLNLNYSIIRVHTFFDLSQQSRPLPDYLLAGLNGQIILQDGSLVVAEYGAGMLLRLSRHHVMLGKHLWKEYV